MKRFICALFLICMVFVACDMGDNGNGNKKRGDNENETISLNNLSVKDTSIKSLYISDIPVNNGRAASGSTIQTLAYINSDGENTPFFFMTPSGKNIALDALSVFQVDEKRITINFAYYYIITENKDGSYKWSESIRVDQTGLIGTDQRRALVDFERNKVYDFSGLEVHTIDDDVVFVRDYNNATIYKIDLNDVSVAIPLNDSTHFPMGTITLFGNKIVSYGSGSLNGLFVIDINKDFPITPLKNGSINNDMCSFIPTGSSYEVDIIHNISGLIFRDPSGDTWFFIAGGKTPGLDRYGVYTSPNLGNPNKYFIGKINIDDGGQVSLTDYYESTFLFTPDNNENGFLYGNSKYELIKKDIVIMYHNGFISIKGTANGIQIESASLPTLTQEKSFAKDDYLYYFENDDIKRIHLSAGSSAEILYSNNRILTNKDITVVGDAIFFYQFADDNISVNTYSLSLNQQNPTPKLLSTSSVEIRNIIELDF